MQISFVLVIVQNLILNRNFNTRFIQNVYAIALETARIILTFTQYIMCFYNTFSLQRRYVVNYTIITAIKESVTSGKQELAKKHSRVTSKSKQPTFDFL